MVPRKKATEKPSTNESRGRGRPATGRIRGEKIGVRCTEEEKARIEAAAAAAGMTPGTWLLEQGLQAAG